MLHVVLAPAARLLDEVRAAGLHFLSEEELARYHAARAAKRRDAFLAGRWLARNLLADVLGGDHDKWLLQAKPDMPPEVVGRPDLSLSISHSGEWIACALSNSPVGVDVECEVARRDVMAMAGIVCSHTEWQWLAALPLDEARWHFHAMWTMKEAWLKRYLHGLDYERMRTLRAMPAAVKHANACHHGALADGLHFALSNEHVAAAEWHGDYASALAESTYWQQRPVQA